MTSLLFVDPTSALDGRFAVAQGPAGSAGVIVLAGERPWRAPAAAPAAGAPGGAPAAGGNKKKAAGAASGGAAGGAAGGAVSSPPGAGPSDSKGPEEGAPKQYYVSPLSLEERYAICRSVGEECVQEEELMALLKAKQHPICYDGFEPSGRMHIAQGVLKSINVNKLTSAGCIFKFWVADWFALLNKKMGGDLKKIQVVGKYFIEVWKACGMNMQNVEFYWTSEEINAHANEYWLRVMDIATKFNLARMQRCCTIMGRKEDEEMSASQIFYPAMQCADVFFLKADICQLGMDQRKVNMLAREYCDEATPKIKHKPVILSHHMLMGLKQGQAKMSKSDTGSAIFMEDTAEEVRIKIKGAFCPPGVVEDNPCFDWMKHIVFAKYGSVLVSRTPENGGDKTFTSYEDMCADYVAGSLHPGDVKATLVKYINEILEPVRIHFSSGEPKKLLEQVKRFRVTK